MSEGKPVFVFLYDVFAVGPLSVPVDDGSGVIFSVGDDGTVDVTVEEVVLIFETA